MSKRGKGTRSPGAVQRDALDPTNAHHPLSDADQTSHGEDTTASNAERTRSDPDRTGVAREALDRARAYREEAAHTTTTGQPAADEASRAVRQATLDRAMMPVARSGTARARDVTADARDDTAESHDDAALLRDTRAAGLLHAVARVDPELAEELNGLRAEAAADRARAASDRDAAKLDRAQAARERAALEGQLRDAHLDDLTGAYRREMGRLVLSHEIERARRSDGRFVLAFVDVDDLKVINDRDGHPTGDRVLRLVAAAMRAKLRSFDPVMRYGGDEFVAGMGSTDLAMAERRFDDIRRILTRDANVGISVGFAVLADGDTTETLIARADEALLRAKAERRHDRT